ncbi:class I SAM-dependent methyltransferase, partial [Candidatus Dependentiae bacterium]|nr:class I SAM-dependent methyltransferase [Candidatus Dependentiae bacterium]
KKLELLQILYLIKETQSKILKCVDCSIIFMSPQLSDTEIYEENYYYFNNYPEKSVKEDQIKSNFILKYIASNFPEAKSIFDIGAATGIFLNESSKKGFKINGMEISKAGCSIAESVFGINLFCGSIEDYNKKIDSDIVIMTDVLEHTYNPDKTLNKIYQLTKKGAKIIIETPNIGSFYYKIAGKKWVGFNQYHNFHFTKNSLIRLAENQNFKILSVFTTNFNILSAEGFWRTGLKDIIKSILIKTNLLKTITKINSFECTLNIKKISEILLKKYKSNIFEKIFYYINFPINKWANIKLSGDQIWIILEK